jgi:hypothetical protein
MMMTGFVSLVLDSDFLESSHQKFDAPFRKLIFVFKVLVQLKFNPPYQRPEAFHYPRAFLFFLHHLEHGAVRGQRAVFQLFTRNTALGTATNLKLLGLGNPNSLQHKWSATE